MWLAEVSRLNRTNSKGRVMTTQRGKRPGTRLATQMAGSPSMRADAVAAFLNVGLQREKLALAQRGRLQAKLAKQWETDPSVIEILVFAITVLEREDVAYQWLTQTHVKGKAPLEALVDGEGGAVRRLLANMEHGLPI
jgi:hypothetical protein